ncbi:stalk domain-containing protein [Paenibacillus sp. NPDC058174]|uniref:stalk domain-containing protein n=1 Tax=Paenibacillus sp. NPDC058174 TaxID=3346366 RepID=UPI0036D86ACE
MRQSKQKKASRTYLSLVFMMLCFAICMPIGTATAASTVESSLHKPLRSDAVLKLGSTTAVVNGMEMKVQPVYEKNGITMGPANVLIRMFRLDYSYDKEDKRFLLKTRLYEKQWFSFVIGQRKGQEGNVTNKTETFELSTAPVEKKGSLMVPLREFVEKLGGKIAYDAKTKEIRITGVNRPVVDSKYRIGDSSKGWSIAAPKGFTPDLLEKAREGCENCYFVEGFTKDRQYSVIFSVRESEKKLTLKQLQEQQIAELHPSKVVMETRFAKVPAGEFSVVSTSQNYAFSILYDEYWSIQVGDRIYQITFGTDNSGNGNIVGERDRVILAFMETFRTSFDMNNTNQLDLYREN